MSAFRLAIPRARIISADVAASGRSSGSRPMVDWISGSKSCTPIEARFIPAAASASRRGASISFGSISTENSPPSASGAASKIASASREISAGGSSVGVPPPQCSRLTADAGRRDASRSSAISAQQRLDIGDDGIVGWRALGAAGAEPAKPAAEGNVDVERDLAVRRDRRDPSRRIRRRRYAVPKCGAVG